MAFEINPLSRQPMASCTGAVEQKWLATKIAATTLVFLSVYVTPVTVTVCLLFLSSYTMLRHVKTLPFHSTIINHIRGGVYMTIVWLAISSIIVASRKTEGIPQIQANQWVYIALLPIAFVVGVVIIRLQYMSLERSLVILQLDHSREIAHRQQQFISDTASVRAGSSIKMSRRQSTILEHEYSDLNGASSFAPLGANLHSRAVPGSAISVPYNFSARKASMAPSEAGVCERGGRVSRCALGGPEKDDWWEGRGLGGRLCARCLE